MEKYSRATLTTEDNMTHAHCILENQGYRHTLRISNTSSFSTAKMVARMGLIVASCVHFLSLSNSPVPVFINASHLVSKVKISSPFSARQVDEI